MTRAWTVSPERETKLPSGVISTTDVPTFLERLGTNAVFVRVGRRPDEVSLDMLAKRFGENEGVASNEVLDDEPHASGSR